MDRNLVAFATRKKNQYNQYEYYYSIVVQFISKPECQELVLPGHSSPIIYLKVIAISTLYLIISVSQTRVILYTVNTDEKKNLLEIAQEGE